MNWTLKKAVTYFPTIAVSSAQTGLTSLFGKVRGEPRRNNHLNFRSLLYFKQRSFGINQRNILTYWNKR